MKEIPLFIHWERTLNDLLDRTMKFPKRVRFTFSNRIDNHALDVMERVVDPCFAVRFLVEGEKAGTVLQSEKALRSEKA